MDIRLLKRIDNTVGRIIASCLPPPRQRKSNHAPSSFLVIRPGGIGDAVLLIPSLLALKEKYPGAEITVLAEQRNGATFQLCPAVSRILRYDRPVELLEAVRRDYHVVIDTEQWHRLSALVARFTRAQISIGYATNERQRLFTHSVPYSHDDHETSSFFHLLKPLALSHIVNVGYPYLTVPTAAGRIAGRMLGPLGGKQFVAVFPGASIPNRRWGVEKYNALVEGIYRHGIPVVVVGGKLDAADGDRIIAGKCGLNLAGKTTLAETAAVIDKSTVLVSGDSGILHIAVGLDIPTVSLFGPGIAKKWAPRGDRHIVINKELPCSPCTRFGSTRKCAINAKCMSDITVDEVEDAVLKLLDRTMKNDHVSNKSLDNQ